MFSEISVFQKLVFSGRWCFSERSPFQRNCFPEMWCFRKYPVFENSHVMISGRRREVRLILADMNVELRGD